MISIQERGMGEWKEYFSLLDFQAHNWTGLMFFNQNKFQTTAFIYAPAEKKLCS